MITKRDLYALPDCLGGLGLINPCSAANSCFCNSEWLTFPLVALIVVQYVTQTVDHGHIHQPKQSIRKNNCEHQTMVVDTLQNNLSPSLKHCVDLAKESGSSSWLTVLSILEHGFHLYKGDFWDAYLHVMASHHLIHQVLASVESLSQLTMLWYVLLEDYLPSDIMRFII